jgi:hypothetical protein
MKNAYACAVLVTAFLVLPGCATITAGEMQTVSVTTQTQDGKNLERADCVLKNERGEWKASTPAQIAVRRSADDLMVSCRKDGEPDGMLRAISRASGNMVGNIIIGGGIGALIDHSKGTGYNYPDDLPVKMGASVTVDKSPPASREPDERGSSQ